MKHLVLKFTLIFIFLIANNIVAGKDDKTRDSYFYKGGKQVSVTVSAELIAVHLKDFAKQTPQLQQKHTLLSPKKPILFENNNIAIFRLDKRLDKSNFQALKKEILTDKNINQVYRVVMLKETNTPLVLTKEIVVRFKENVSKAKREKLITEQGLVQLSESKTRSGRYVYRLKPGTTSDVLDVANRVYESGMVKFAHPNFIANTIKRTLPNQPVIPNDALFNDQWHLNNTGQSGGTVDADIDAPEAWDFTLGNNGIVIAVLDDGIDIGHDDLIPNIVAGGRDFTADPPDNDPSPGIGDDHGTAVSGVAVARGDNTIGVSGSCPRCGLLPIRMLGGSFADHADAFDYAVAQGASVITNSWGYNIGTVATDDIEDAINDAAANGRGGRGAIVLFAMTNTNVDNCVNPTPDISSLDSVIAVSRSTNLDEMGNAGFGTCMDVLAPTRGGTLGITTTDREGGDGYVAGDYYDNFGGTSSATPLTAGIAGQLLSLNNNLTRDQVQQILEQTAEKIQSDTANYDANGFSTTHGHGRVNAHRAIVPTVKISIEPPMTKVGQPFSIKVTGSAPYGLNTIWWFGQGTGITELDKAHMQNVPGNVPVYTYTWTDIIIDQPGTYTFGANVRDIRYPTPGDGYPHQASEGSGIATAQITISGSDICPLVKAAEASYLEPHLGSVREFRNAVLIPNTAGKELVSFYYEVAPKIVSVMEQHEALTPVVRIAVTPIVYSIVYPTIPVVFMMLVIGFMFSRRCRKAKQFKG